MGFKNGLFLVGLLGCFSARAQWNTGGDIDQNWFHLGFQLGGNSNSLIIEKKADYNSNALYGLGFPTQNPGIENPARSGNLSFIQPYPMNGFHLGLLANFRLSDNLDIRFTPDFNFSDRALSFGYESPVDKGLTFANPVRKTIASTYADFPLLLKFKSDRKRNIRAYIIGGVQYSYDITPSKKSDDRGLDEISKLVKIKKNDFSFRIGIGLDLYYEYFKMSPEIAIVNSFSGVLKSEDHVFSRPIKNLFPTSVLLTLYFE